MAEIILPHSSLSETAIALLQERADRIARTEKKTIVKSSFLKKTEDGYLCIRMVDEYYGFPLNCINEVIQLSNIVPVPRTPDHVTGITRLRGKVLALIDLRCFWYGNAMGHADSDFAVVIELKGIDFGLLCTRVEGLLEMADGEIREVPKNISDRQAKCLRGIAGRNIMLIDPSSLLLQQDFLVQKSERGE